MLVELDQSRLIRFYTFGQVYMPELIEQIHTIQTLKLFGWKIRNIVVFLIEKCIIFKWRLLCPELLISVTDVCCEFVTFPLVSWVRCGT